MGGANGAAPTDEHIINMETEVAVDNADINTMRYVMNASTRGKLKRTFVDPGSGLRLWDNRTPEAPVNGYMAEVTNQMPGDIAKGSGTNLSALGFGAFSEVLVALWSGVDLLVNPYSGDTTRTTRITAYQDADANLRHPESWAFMEDAITT